MQPKTIPKSLRLILIAALSVVILAVAVPCTYAYYEQSFAQGVPMKTAQQCDACLKDAGGHFAVKFETPAWTAIFPEEPAESAPESESPESEEEPEQPAENESAEPEPEPEPTPPPVPQAYAMDLALTNGASADTFQAAFLTAALRFYSKQAEPDAAELSFTAGGNTYTAVREAVPENTALAISGVRWQFRFLDAAGNEKTFLLPGGKHSESGTVRVLLTPAQTASPQEFIPAEVILSAERF